MYKYYTNIVQHVCKNGNKTCPPVKCNNYSAVQCIYGIKVLCCPNIIQKLKCLPPALMKK